MSFELHDSLASAFVSGDLPLRSASLMNDPHWPHLVFVPRGKRLNKRSYAGEQSQSTEEAGRATRFMKSHVNAIDVGELRNIVSSIALAYCRANSCRSSLV
jgi:hypothetical protein